MNAFLVAISLFPPGPRLAERASVQTSIKWALVVLFASVRKGAPHAHEKWEKCPFDRHLHACTLTHAQTGAEFGRAIQLGLRRPTIHGKKASNGGYGGCAGESDHCQRRPNQEE